MDEEPEEALLNEEEINEMINEFLHSENPQQPKSKGKLKDWRVFCKLRGKKSMQK